MTPDLGRIRVADLSTGIGGAYTTKMFADAGAEVIKVETSGPDPLRRWSSTGADPGDRDGAFFRFLHASKLAVAGPLESVEVLDIVASADLIVDGLLPGAEDDALESARTPGSVRVSITPYGRTGPYARRPATEFVVQAESGSGARRGLKEMPPFHAAGRITEYIAAVYAATAAAAALRAAERTGQGAHIDVSWLEAITLAANIFSDLQYRLEGSPPITRPPRWVELPSIEPTKDGWVGFNTNTRQQYDDFLVLIGQTDIEGAEEMARFPVRQLHADRWNAAVRSYTTAHTTDEIVELASMLRIPVAPVNSGRTVLDDGHLQARGAFVSSPDREFVHPRPPYLFDGEPLLPRSPAPGYGEHNRRIPARAARLAAPAPAAAGPAHLPLAGVRILDCTAWWAGPSSTVALAALGADVIHVESTVRPDAARTAGSAWLGRDGQWWEGSSMFIAGNTNKRGITLDLSIAEGLQAMVKLVKGADAVVENFSPRVFDNFGLGADAMRQINPRAVLVRMPAFGLSGPWRDHVGFAQTMEQMTGLAWITSFPEDQPRIQQGPCDPLAGLHAAFGLLVALDSRDRTGVGGLVEIAMVEGALNAASEQIVEWSCYGREMQREGNRSPYAAPQGLYACPGWEQWLAISCETDEHWEALCTALDRPDWRAAERFRTFAARRVHHDELDAELTAWASTHPLDDAVEWLVGSGVPAAPARDPRLYSAHPQTTSRGFHEEVDHPIAGVQPLPRPPFTYSGIDTWIRRRAPLLGEHNHEVLGEAGYTAAEIDELERLGVTGTRPAGI